MLGRSSCKGHSVRLEDEFSQPQRRFSSDNRTAVPAKHRLAGTWGPICQEFRTTSSAMLSGISVPILDRYIHEPLTARSKHFTQAPSLTVGSPR